MKVLGIDPGITGAVVSIVDDELINVLDMPVMDKTAGNGKMIDYLELAELMKEFFYYSPNKIVIESVHAMPRQGGVSNFSFGRALGILEGVIAGILSTNGALLNGRRVKPEIIYVTPQKWKKNAGITGSNKDYARKVVIDEFPEHKDFFKRKKDIGRADAVLIAKYGSI